MTNVTSAALLVLENGTPAGSHFQFCPPLTQATGERRRRENRFLSLGLSFPGGEGNAQEVADHSYSLVRAEKYKLHWMEVPFMLIRLSLFCVTGGKKVFCL